jgi:hypothetical protein
MTLCRSRGEFGGASTGAKSLNAVFRACLGARAFSQAFAPAIRFAGCFKAQAHASLWRARLSIALAREKFGLAQRWKGVTNDGSRSNVPGSTPQLVSDLAH